MTRARTAAVRTAALLLLLACCAAALAQTTFTQQTYKTNDGASMAVADLNGDGKPDMVVNHEFGNTVDVYLNQGNGTFTDLGSASYVTGPQPLQVVIGDFNGDGKPDIATNNCASTQTPQGTVSFLYGNGDGSFQTHADSAPNGNANCPSSIAVMKSAGGDRLAVATTGAAPSILILSAKSATTISTVSTIPLPAGVVTAQLTSGDYNHDGTADLAVLETDNLGNGSLVLYLSSASGLAPKSVALSLPAGMSAQGIHTVQANNDGVDDLALSLAGNNTAAAQILVNDGTASIWTQRTLTVPGTFEGATGIASADFNGDGINDMLVLAKATETGTDAYAIFPGINGNSWGSPQVVGSGTRIVWQDAAAADFNADQKADFAALSTSDAMIHVFTNQTSPRGNCAVPTQTGIAVCAPLACADVPPMALLVLDNTSLLSI